MKDFANSISAFLSFRKYDILKGKGSISKKTSGFQSNSGVRGV